MRVPSPITARTSPSKQPLQGPSGAGGTPEAFGAAIGRGLSELGANTMALGTFVTQQQEQRKRFDSVRKFSSFQTRASQFFEEAKRSADPTQANFAEVMAAEYQNLEADFINNEIPEELRGEFSARTAQLGEGFAAQALQFQYESTDKFFRNEIETAYNEARLALDQDGSVANLEAQRARVDELLQTSGLSEAEQVALRRQMYIGLESVSYKAEVRAGNIETGALGVGAGGRGGAISLLEEFTGLEPEALQDIVEAAEQVAVQQIGSLDIWAAMPDHARTALLSLIADQGELPQNVLEAIMGGDLAEVRDEILSSAGDHERRVIEAQVLSGEIPPPAAALDADPRFADIPYEDRLALRQDAEREAAAIVTAQNQAETARNKSLVNALHVALLDGTAGQADIDSLREMGVLLDVDDIVKANKLLEDKNNEVRLAAEGWGMIQGERTFTPTSDDDRDRLNAMIGKKGKEAIEGKDSEYAASTLIPIVRTAQDIPTEVAGLLSGMIRSQDLDKAQWAMDLMSQLEQASPKAYINRFTNERDRRDVEFWTARKDYYPAETLMPMVRGGLTQAERAATEQLRAQAADVFRDKKVSDGVLNAIVPWGYSHDQIELSVPWAARALQSEFQGLFIDEYARDGDEKRAKEAAIKSLQSVWAVSEVGGRPSLMKYPPERVGYTPIQGSYDWIDTQVRTELGIADNETFELISDEQTREEFENSGVANVPPSYVVVRVDESGVGRIVMDEAGRPTRMFFEVTPEMQAAQEQEFLDKRNSMIGEDAQRLMNQAAEHSLETALPIPDDFFDADQPGGMLSVLMGESPMYEEE